MALSAAAVGVGRHDQLHDCGLVGAAFGQGFENPVQRVDLAGA
ncbi:MAG: hypothetical protein ACRDRK_16445 [Pseudonocardia sp.]